MAGKKCVLVVGASSYVSRHLCSLLLPHNQVWGTYFQHPIENPAQNLALDIRNKHAVEKALAEIKPDVVFHLAYDLGDLDGIIVEGTRNLLHACTLLDKACRFVYLSTDSVFDGESAPYSESDIPEPVTPYGHAKRTAETEVLKARGIVVRTSLVYSIDPLDPRTAELLQGLETNDFAYPYFVDEVRCPVFLDDLCAALIEISQTATVEVNIIHIVGPESNNRYEFAKKLARIMGHEPEKVPMGYISESGSKRPRDISLNISLAKRMLETKLRKIDDIFPLIHRLPRYQLPGLSR